MIVDSAYSFLAADAGVAALCQAIYPLTIPQGSALPAITYSLDDERRDLIFDGPADLLTAFIEFTAWHTDHAGVHAVADAIDSALAGHRGTFGSKTAEHIRRERKFELFESDTGLYRVSQQYLIAYY